MNRKSVSVGINRYEEKRYNQFLRKLQKPFEFYSLEQKQTDVISGKVTLYDVIPIGTGWEKEN